MLAAGAETDAATEFLKLTSHALSLTHLVNDFIAYDHGVYGNLEYIARCLRNIAFVVVWASLSEDNADKLLLPIVEMNGRLKKVVAQLEAMKGARTGFLYR
jgi:hypothetical protein